MKKAFILLLIFIFALCGCSSLSESTSSKNDDTVSVILPDVKTAQSVNGYYIPPKDEGDIKYYANINTKKFHLESCRFAASTKEENLMITSDRSRLIKDGYIPCKSCKP